MDGPTLVRRHPQVFHVAPLLGWPSIQRRGLLSATALADLHGVGVDARRTALLQKRGASITWTTPGVGAALIRDQLPLRFLERRLEAGVTVEEFLAALNSRVFFAATRKRLDRLLGAREYRGRPQVVLTVDTAELVARYGRTIGLCRFNSGACAQLNHPLRGPGSWRSIAAYPYDDYRRRYASALVEVTVPGAVPDVLDFTDVVEHVTP